jgi:type II secretion system protein N
MRRALVATGVVLATFGVVAALTFPTDAIVRGLVARVPLPQRLALAFERARLGFSGLRLEDVHVTRPDGSAAFDAEWLRLRPSLLGFWRDRTGRPWSAGLSACHGTVDVEVGADGATTPLAVSFENVELGACLPYVAPQVAAYGRVSGVVHARVSDRDPATGDAAIEVRGAAWRPGGAFEQDALRIDAGTLRATLADRRLEIATLEASSADFRARGRGSVRFVTPTDDSVLDLRLAVTPTATMPPSFRRILDGVPGAAPDASGTRVFRIQGTMQRPRIVAAGTFE